MQAILPNQTYHAWQSVEGMSTAFDGWIAPEFDAKDFDDERANLLDVELHVERAASHLLEFLTESERLIVKNIRSDECSLHVVGCDASFRPTHIKVLFYSSPTAGGSIIEFRKRGGDARSFIDTREDCKNAIRGNASGDSSSLLEGKGKFPDLSSPIFDGKISHYSTGQPMEYLRDHKGFEPLHHSVDAENIDTLCNCLQSSPSYVKELCAPAILESLIFMTSGDDAATKSFFHVAYAVGFLVCKIYEFSRGQEEDEWDGLKLMTICENVIFHLSVHGGGKDVCQKLLVIHEATEE
jgi:hypothetical protein